MARESHLTWDMRLPDERKILAGNDEAPETALVAPDLKSPGYGALEAKLAGE